MSSDNNAMDPSSSPDAARRDLLAKRLAVLSEEKRALLKSRLRGQRHTPAMRHPIPAGNDSGDAPLAFAQEHFWLLEQLAPGSLAYNRPTNARIHGPLDPAILGRSLNEIARRHEVLRTRYRQTEDLPIPVVSDDAGLRLDVVDLRSLPEPDRRSECLRLAIEEARRPFDLAAVPPVRAKLFRVADEEHLLSFTVHHIAFDGWSQGIFFRELGSLYHALRRDEAPSLPSPPIRYSDYARWQRQWAEGPEGERHLQYWRDRLRGATSILELPADHDRPAAQRDHGARHAFLLPHDLTAALEALGQRENATLFMTLLAAFNVLLFRHTGQEDIIVGSPFSGRTRPETELLVGLFANTLPLRTDLSGNPPFAGLLHRVRDASLEAQAHQEIPLQLIIQNIALLRDFSRNALFQHLFVLQNTPGPPPGPRGTRFLPEDLDTGTSKLDLTVELRRTEHGLEGFLEYDTDLFEAETIGRMAGHWRRLLEAIAADPTQRIADLPMLTGRERHRLLVEWNDTRRDSPPRNCVHELFEAQVRQTPDAIAAIFEGSHLTYAELNARANQLAHFLRASSVGPEVLVGLCLERSPHMAVALLAILKAGGAYVPLDPDYPRERLGFIVGDSRPAVVLTVTSLIDRFADPGVPIVCLDAERDRIAQHDRFDPPSIARPENTIYVIYTSGSTGKPKGAINTHRGVANFLLWERDCLAFDATDRMLFKTALSFDISVFEFFLPLVSGGSVVFAKPGGQLEPGYLARLIQAQNVTATELVPSHLRALLDDQALARCRSLKWVSNGGEALTLGLAKRFFEQSGAKLYNSYGPTETAVGITRWECPRDSRKIAIGRPGHNIRLYILDPQQNPVPVGVPGELYIGGIAVGRGYLNLPELTAERFIPDPFSGSAGDRMYRTGDRCRYLPDGNIEFLGRLDNQVKVRGNRIELGEVEAAIGRHPVIADAAVAVRATHDRENALVAFLVPRSGDPGTGEARARLAEELRRSLRATLPEPMIPQAFQFLTELPRLPNGKLDRGALPAADISPAPPDGYIAPRTPTEIQVAAIWAEVLGLERVGALDNFFQIGGHSLSAARITARIRTHMGVDLPVRAIFDAPTIRDLAARIEPPGDRGAGSSRETGARSAEATCPLSFGQRRLWFIQQLEPQSALYNVTHSMRLKGPLDAGALERCLLEIVRRHATLRTTFPALDGEPVQRVDPNPSVELPLTDLASLPGASQETEFRRLLASTSRRPFDLARDPMLRPGLFRFRDDEHVLTLTFHHIATDGWSMGILWKELAALYDAFATGQPSPLPDLPMRYVEHALRQRQRLDDGHLEQERLYWRRRLAGAPAVLEIPFDYPIPSSPTYCPASHSITLGPDLTSALRRFSRAEHATSFMTLLAAFKVLLARHAGQEDIVVGSPLAGRTSPATEPLIGLFLNTVALRTDLGGNPPFRELLRRVRETTLGALAHQVFPFENVVEELRPKRLQGRNPLFDVLFNYMEAGPNPRSPHGLAMEPVEIDPPNIQFAMTLYVTPRADQIELRLVFRKELFSPQRMRHLVGQYRHLLRQVADAPDTRIRRFGLVTPESIGVLPDPTAVLAAPEQEPVTQTFSMWAMETPDHPAVCHAGATWSYATLYRHARDISGTILARGSHPADVVAISGEKGPGLIAALLGALFSGCVILPIDPSLSPQRKRLMLRAAGARRVIRVGIEPPGDPWLDEVGDIDVLNLDQETARFIGPAPSPPAARFDSPLPADRSPAYIFYTSGTTGTPKAILGSHAGLAHFLKWQRTKFGIRPGDRVAQVTSLSFDVVLRDIFLPLTSGATLCVPRPGHTADGQDLIPWLKSERVSVLHAVPTVARHWLDSAPTGTMLPDLRLVFFAGEPLHDTLVRRWRARCHPGCEIINLYGPTETTLVRCFHRVPEEIPPGIQPIGRSLPDSQALVLNEEKQPCGIGEIGEIVIRSPFRSLGYLNLPDQPGFVQNPFRGDAADLLYHTGDLGRFRPDGALEILGRRDDQVKIRGVRVEPAEVTAAIQRHPAVRDCAVVPVARDDREPQLAAFVVTASPTPDIARELRAHLSRELPAAMIPSQFIIVDRLPRTPGGKVDRRALPEPGSDRDHVARQPAPPQTPLQAQLVALWTELLASENIGTDDDFFELGGHSLMAARLISRIRRLIGIDVPLRDLFETPTIAGLATRIHAIQALGQAHPEPALAPAIAPGDRPLSFAQQRLWFLDRLLAGGAVYNIPMVLRLQGSLDVAALGRSLREIVRRHAVLRTTFHEAGGEPVQRITPAADLPLTAHDLREFAEADRDSCAQNLVAETARQPFDLTRELPLRACLVRLSDRTNLLCLTVHHIAADGWSMGILRKELSALYAAFAAGHPSPLPELPIQYADCAIRQRDRLRGEQLDRPLAYWRRQLANAPPVLPLPTDRPRPTLPSHRGDQRVLALGRPLKDALASLSRQEGTTLFMTLLAAFQTLLSRYSGQEDIVVGSPVAGRDHIETEPLIGFFVNTLALRTDLSGNPTFRELLGRVREITLDALTHQELPFEKLVEEIQPERNPGLAPIFQVMFVLQNAPASMPDLPGLAVSQESAHTGTAKFDLVLSISRDGDGLDASLEFSTDLFDASTIERMLGHFHALLGAAAADPDIPIGKLPLLGTAERHQILVGWNDTKTDYPRDRCVHELFEDQAGQNPQAPAVTCGPRQLTYAELDDRANRLAHHLRRSGVTPDTPVGVALGRSTEMIVGLLAILKAGGAYVPLDPDYPSQRLAFMLGDTRAPIILTQESLSASVPASKARRILLDRDWGTIARESPERLPAVTSPDNLAYIVYTSGSTGQPKGVCVTHRGVVRLVRGNTYARMDAREVFLQFAPLSFDAATFEIWGALLNGAKLVVFPPHMPSLKELGRVVRDSGITTLWLTAGLFHKMIDHRPQDLRGVHQLLAGGDVLSPPHVRRALMAIPDCTIINGYGPTENTTFSCCHPLRDANEVPHTVPIGRPIANSEAYVLDRHLQPVPIGVPGELFLGGDGLARGYLNKPDLDADRFIAHPFRDDPGARLYRSGDLARWRPDGTLEFLGRIDRQVKIRGFRIELGEIEASLAGHPGVRQCAAVAREDHDGERFIAAAIVPADPKAPPDVEALREFLRQTLPGYMIPSAILHLERLPLTENGKVDRSALESIPLTRANPENRYTPPENPSQLLLVHLWEELLGVSPIGIRDDFFALGGHSLLATGMLGQVEELCGRKIPLTTFFAEPTIACLSRALLAAERDEAASPIVSVQAGDGRRPFFFLHGDFSGGGFYCRKLARHLGKDQAFYAIHPHGLMGRRFPASIQAMAADHLRLLRAVQPEGPYLIGGHCNGALEAYEIARLLHAQGQRVDLVVMIAPPRRPRISATSIGFLCLRHLMRPILPLIPTNAANRWAPKIRPHVIMAAYAAICWSYFPRPYPGRVILLQPKDRAGSSDDPSRGWRDAAHGLEVFPLPHGHASAITRQVEDVARCILPFLRPAAENSG